MRSAWPAATASAGEERGGGLSPPGGRPVDGGDTAPASLEELLETEDLGLEVFHPGGRAITRETAERCGVGPGKAVLEVACGTGESACWLVRSYGATVTALDRSPRMVAAARAKSRSAGLPVEVVRGDAHLLPFADATFDVVISECALSLLDHQRALGEIVRVTRPGGRVGIHEICWQESAPERARRLLAELEGERAETLEGWRGLLEEAGLHEVTATDRSGAIPDWMRELSTRLGWTGRLRVAWRVLRRWGARGLLRTLRSERLFRSEHLGYGLLVGIR